MSTAGQQRWSSRPDPPRLGDVPFPSGRHANPALTSQYVPVTFSSRSFASVPPIFCWFSSSGLLPVIYRVWRREARVCWRAASCVGPPLRPAAPSPRLLAFSEGLPNERLLHPAARSCRRLWRRCADEEPMLVAGRIGGGRGSGPRWQILPA